MGRETNRGRRDARLEAARARTASQKLAQARASRRRRALVILVTVVVVAALAAGGAAYGILHKGPVNNTRTAASTSLLSTVTANAAARGASVGAGTVTSAELPYTISGTPLALGAKPTMLFIGAEFCPFCAAERWAIIDALSRFGSFAGLQTITSAEDGLDTFSFLHAHYTSPYLRFEAREQADQSGRPLQPLTSLESRQWDAYLTPGYSRASYPFVDLNGRFVFVSGMVDPGLLDGKTWRQIAAAIADPTTSLGRAEVGAANYLSAAICRETDDRPTTACPASITSLTNGLTPYP